MMWPSDLVVPLIVPGSHPSCSKLVGLAHFLGLCQRMSVTEAGGNILENI